MLSAAMAAIVAVLAACALGVLVVAERLRTQLRIERIASRLARERDAAVIESMRRLGNAALRSCDDVRAEIDAAVRRIAPAVDAVLLFDDDAAELACTFASGDRVAYFAGARIARTDLALLPARALVDGHRAVLGAGQRSFHPADAFALAVPLPRDDGRSSVLYVAAPVRVDDDRVETIVALAESAAFAYALAGEREADRRRAEYDALTGLLTPRAFRERLATLLERARTAPLARIALLFVDTDGFKPWNDSYGHASGDALLRALARTLQSAAGADDLVARNGGDEFCVVFVDTEKSAAIVRAEALRAAIAGLDVAPLRPAGAAAGVRVTASIGVAAYPADAANASELLERADAAMYATKRSGRNGVAYIAVDGSHVRADAPAVATP
jgi:diguanylate cyclase (GGDEF)-like protein